MPSPYDSSTPCVSFIGIVDFTEDARWVYCSESVSDLLGWEPRELIGRRSLDLVHPDELPDVKELHFTTISQDQAAVLAYLRMRHKDPCKGYILCGISRTVCQNVLVGSVSFAAPGAKAMHNASTAQEVKIITPTAKDLEFRRWNDPNPMPPCPVPAAPRRAPRPLISFDPLPEQSVRTALILDRFSLRCGVLYCANDSVLETTACLGRSFFDFVAPRDDALVRSWVTVVKGWGVNERGQPSDGGFGFGKFAVLVRGRDSSVTAASPPPRQRGGARDAAHPPAREKGGRSSRELGRKHGAREHHHPQAHGPPSPREDELLVDAIFSAHSDGLMVILRKAAG